MAISPETIEEVLRIANVYDVISQYITLERTGSNYRALCPFHQERTPSFMVSPQKNIFKCFGCGKSGNAIKFVMEYEGISFPEAIVKIAQRYNIPVKYTGTDKEGKEVSGLFEVIKKVALFYKEQLKKSEKARKYLTSRDINSSTIDFFDIGYSPEDSKLLLDYCEKEGISKEDLKNIGVISLYDEEKIVDKFKGRVVFPIKDHKGRIVAFGGRSIDKSKNPKYINSPETSLYSKSKILYGLYEAKDTLREKKEVIIVEGYFDLISLYQIGIKNVVATLGTSLTEKHAELLKKFVNRAYLMFDNDKAGKNAAVRASKMLLSKEIEVYYIPLEKKDPDELSKEGRKTVEMVINSSQDFLVYILDKVKETKDLKKEKNLIDLYLDILSYIPDKHIQGLYLKKLSEETGIPLQFLEVKKRENKETEEEKEVIGKSLFYPEKIILKTLIFEKDKLLSMFKDFDKIEGSEYFIYLLNLIINNQLSEGELEEIKSFNVPVDTYAALEALKKLHKNWIKSQIELSALFNKTDEKILSLIIKNNKEDVIADDDA